MQSRKEPAIRKEEIKTAEHSEEHPKWKQEGADVEHPSPLEKETGFYQSESLNEGS